MKKNKLFTISIFIGFSILIMILLIFILKLFFKDEGNLIFIISVPTVIICLSAIIIFTVYWYIKSIDVINKLLEDMIEKEMIRKYEFDLSKNNLKFREEVEKWNQIYQITKLTNESFSKKYEHKDNPKQDIDIPIAKSLINAIKEIRKEFDK